MILGRYRPKCLLVTTPNFSFNQLFTKPGYLDPGAFPDPTGRTNRHFRHDDHKFEWTEEEFRAWCEKVAAAYGYEVEVSGVGKPIGEDPYGRAAPSASQTALFRRGEGREPRRQQLPIPEDEDTVPHTQVACHLHEAHPSAAVFKSSHDIRCRVREIFNEIQYGETTILDLWNDWQLPFMCGGSLACLLNAMEEAVGEWEIKDTEASRKNRLALAVTWQAFIAKEPNEQEERTPSPMQSEVDVDYDEIADEENGWPVQSRSGEPAGGSNDWDWGSDDPHHGNGSAWGEGQDWEEASTDTTAHDTAQSAWTHIPA